MAEININIYAIILLATLFQAIVFGVILFIRAASQQNQSDYILALLIFIMGFAAVPHLFGWLGIGVLWNQLTFYPWNGLELAVLPTVLIFLRSRLNNQWRFSLKEIQYYWLYILYFFYHLAIGIQGKEYAKWWWFEVNNKYNIDAVFSFCNVLLFAYQLIKFNKIHKTFQKWSANRYSNMPLLSISTQLPSQGWDIARAGVGLSANFDMTFKALVSDENIAFTVSNTPTLKVKIYPNPTIGALTIESSEVIESLVLLNMAGKALLTGQNNTMDLTNLPNGIYNLVVIVKGEKTIRRIVKQ